MFRYGIVKGVVNVHVWYCERGGLCPGIVL